MGYQSKYTGNQIEQALDVIHGLDHYVASKISESQKELSQKITNIDNNLQDLTEDVEANLNNPWIEL